MSKNLDDSRQQDFLPDEPDKIVGKSTVTLSAIAFITIAVSVAAWLGTLGGEYVEIAVLALTMPPVVWAILHATNRYIILRNRRLRAQLNRLLRRSKAHQRNFKFALNSFTSRLASIDRRIEENRSEAKRQRDEINRRVDYLIEEQEHTNKERQSNA